jgi:hypothetical protein
MFNNGVNDLDIAPVGSIPTNNKQNRKLEKPKNKKKRTLVKCSL